MMGPIQSTLSIVPPQLSPRQTPEAGIARSAFKPLNARGGSLVPPMLILGAILALAWNVQPLAAQSGPLTSLRAIRALQPAEVRDGIPAAFEATVTFYNPRDVDLFVQDGDDAIYVEMKPGLELMPGDRVLVRGKTRKSFTVDIVGDEVSVLHSGALPTAVSTDFERLIRAEMDCRWVSVHATVRSADIVHSGEGNATYLRLSMDGGIVDATVLGIEGNRDDLLDAEVEVHGAVSGKFDSKMQIVGILLEVPGLSYVKVLKRASRSVDSLPVVPMDSVLSAQNSLDRTSRVRVRGTITYYQPGWAAVLQNGTRSLWISTNAIEPMRIGDIAEATGFPDARAGFLTLLDGEVKDTNVSNPVEPAAATWRQLSIWNTGEPDGHQSDLVSFEGVVVAAVRAGSQDEFVLNSDGRLFTAIYRHPPSRKSLPSMLKIPAGTRIRVTGICMAEPTGTVDPNEKEMPFNILLRSFDDIKVLAQPSFLSVRNLMLLAGFLLLLLLAAGVRAWVTERKFRQQNARLAYVERRRGRILEDINGTRPLAEIISEIAELVSLGLPDAIGWCQIHEGGQTEPAPHLPEGFRVVREPIPSWSGKPHGTICAALPPWRKPQASESEILSRSGALASLAIETRRLYSDLVHRSDFDLLTDVHNRFSLEKQLDRLLEQSRLNQSMFGLLYIDLDGFKQVNDRFGHKIGDLYLQEVAARLKHQLRGMDMLARIGGDEFAVLLPSVHSRAEVEEVARRVQRGVDGIFVIEGCSIHGAASVGTALYPEDGENRDTILSAADAAMYGNKQIRQDAK